MSRGSFALGTLARGFVLRFLSACLSVLFRDVRLESSTGDRVLGTALNNDKEYTWGMLLPAVLAINVS